MFNDRLIQEWITEHGKATSFTFLVYGKIKEEEVDLITKGVLFGFNSDEGNIAIFYDEIDEEQACAWNTYQGTSLSYVFGGDYSGIESKIVDLILSGLKFLRYKAEYKGIYFSDSYV